MSAREGAAMFADGGPDSGDAIGGTHATAKPNTPARPPTPTSRGAVPDGQPSNGAGVSARLSSELIRGARTGMHDGVQRDQLALSSARPQHDCTPSNVPGQFHCTVVIWPGEILKQFESEWCLKMTLTHCALSQLLDKCRSLEWTNVR